MASQPAMFKSESIILRLSEPVPDATPLERRIADALHKGISYSPCPYVSLDLSNTEEALSGDVGSVADADSVARSNLYEGVALARSEATFDTELSDILDKVVFSDSDVMSSSRSSSEGETISRHHARSMTLRALRDTGGSARRIKSPHTYRLLMNALLRDPGFFDGCALAQFKVEIDTGSNDSWLYSPYLLRLDIDNSDHTNTPSTYTLSSFNESVKRDIPKNKVYAFGYGSTPPEKKTYDFPLPPSVRFVNDPVGLVSVASTPMDITLQNCYRWREEVRRDDLTLKYVFEIMYACTEGVAQLQRFDGRLGLGTMEYQPALGPDHPSFLKALGSQLTRPPDDGTGIVLYFVLRYTIKARPIGRAPRLWPSYLVFNHLPGPWPKISFQRIDAYATEVHPGKWTVKLRRIRIMTIRNWDDKRDSFSADLEFEVNGVIELDDRLFVLDTGISLTYFPVDAAQFLSRTIYGNIRRQGVQGNAAPYFVTTDESKEANEKTEGMVIEYEFVNKAGEAVTVRGPVRGFLVNDVGAGLIWPTKPGMPNILGLSFYHTMFVAKHLPETGDPYIELAPQWPALQNEYILPDDA